MVKKVGSVDVFVIESDKGVECQLLWLWLDYFHRGRKTHVTTTCQNGVHCTSTNVIVEEFMNKIPIKSYYYTPGKGK